MPQATAPPNILLILADDMGFSDIGCFGSEIATPNLDRLAAGGLRLTQHYNCARCCPSRAALLTGLYPHQAGVGDMVVNRGPRAYQGYLSDNCATIPEVLAARGYLSGLAGKWHVGGFWGRGAADESKWTFGDPTRPLPPDRGFDRFWGNPAGGGSYFNVRPLVGQDRIIPCPDGFYGTNSYTDAAIRMMQEAVAAGRPFFVHVCYNAPHWPLHALGDDIARHCGRYAGGWDAIRTARHERAKGMGLLSRKWAISPRDEKSPPWESVQLKDWQDARMAVYAAQVDCMDRNIGRMIDALGQPGAMDNTLILFVSDNGGSAEFLKEDGRKESELPFTPDGRPVRVGNIPGLAPGGPETFMSYDLPWANVSNAPFRLFKHWVHEGGISTPLIAHWPARIASGGLSHEPSHFVDIAATIYDIAGARYPADVRGCAVTPLEGQSFLGLLDGRAWRRSGAMFWEHEGNCAVRDGRWKLVRKFGGGWELYDMVEDRTELADLAARYPADVQRLAALWDDWAARVDVVPWEQLRRR
jgi:arylsulfatase